MYTECTRLTSTVVLVDLGSAFLILTLTKLILDQGLGETASYSEAGSVILWEPEFLTRLRCRDANSSL
jgi:hypothetical protein